MPCRHAISVRTKAERVKQPQEPVWPATNMAVDRPSMSHGELHSHDIIFTSTKKQIVVSVFHSKVHSVTLSTPNTNTLFRIVMVKLMTQSNWLHLYGFYSQLPKEWKRIFVVLKIIHVLTNVCSVSHKNVLKVKFIVQVFLGSVLLGHYFRNRLYYVMICINYIYLIAPMQMCAA